MLEDKDYKLLDGESSCSSLGFVGIRIFVATSREVDLEANDLRYAAYKALRDIRGELLAELLKHDPMANDQADHQRLSILSCFTSPIYVEPLPNGYSSEPAYRHLPWYRITTHVGHFVVGVRRSVISICWNETRGTKTSDELFAEERVTKESRLIHAHTWDDARRYVSKIIETAE